MTHPDDVEAVARELCQLDCGWCPLRSDCDGWQVNIVDAKTAIRTLQSRGWHKGGGR